MEKTDFNSKKEKEILLNNEYNNLCQNKNEILNKIKELNDNSIINRDETDKNNNINSNFNSNNNTNFKNNRNYSTINNINGKRFFSTEKINQIKSDSFNNNILFNPEPLNSDVEIVHQLNKNIKPINIYKEFIEYYSNDPIIIIKDIMNSKELNNYEDKKLK